LSTPAPAPPDTRQVDSGPTPDREPGTTPETGLETEQYPETSPAPAPVESDAPRSDPANTLQTDPDEDDITVAPPPEPEESPSPASESDESLKTVITALPVRVRIPALSLNYEILPTGADRNGTMEIFPALEIVSWFNISAIPGNAGNAILGGHNTWQGVRSRLFNLNDMRIGDEMEIAYDDGTSLTFRLESVFIYALRSAPAHLIMDVNGEARVTIITCKWPYNRSIGTSDNRIVAIFKEESVFVIPDPPIDPFPPRSPSPGSSTQPHDLISSRISCE